MFQIIIYLAGTDQTMLFTGCKAITFTKTIAIIKHDKTMRYS